MIVCSPRQTFDQIPNRILCPSGAPERRIQHCKRPRPSQPQTVLFITWRKHRAFSSIQQTRTNSWGNAFAFFSVFNCVQTPHIKRICAIRFTCTYDSYRPKGKFDIACPKPSPHTTQTSVCMQLSCCLTGAGIATCDDPKWPRNPPCTLNYFTHLNTRPKLLDFPTPNPKCRSHKTRSPSD